jgi:hypothetical protein
MYIHLKPTHGASFSRAFEECNMVQAVLDLLQNESREDVVEIGLWFASELILHEGGILDQVCCEFGLAFSALLVVCVQCLSMPLTPPASVAAARVSHRAVQLLLRQFPPIRVKIFPACCEACHVTVLPCAD